VLSGVRLDGRMGRFFRDVTVKDEMPECIANSLGFAGYGKLDHPARHRLAVFSHRLRDAFHA
jgi:hypothetical protein